METYTVKYASQGIAMLFNQMTQPCDQNMEFIDPLCTIFKICILGYKLEGTKISIKNHTINIQETWALQGLQRWMNSDEKNQLHHLRLTIFYFRGIVLNHIIFEHDKFNNYHYGDILDYINDLAIKGLKKMKLTYVNEKKTNSLLVINCIDEYIKTLNTKYTIDEYANEMNNIHKPAIFAMYNEYTKIWNYHEISIIIDIFKIADTKQEYELQNKLSDAVDQFIIYKDKEIDVIRL